MKEERVDDLQIINANVIFNIFHNVCYFIMRVIYIYDAEYTAIFMAFY